MNIGFFVRHFTERGTEVACYDYAHYNETVLGNKSYIICLSAPARKQYGLAEDDCVTLSKFLQRFAVIEINHISDMREVIRLVELDVFYTITHGGPDIYQFHNKSIWTDCQTIKHCVFDTQLADGCDFHISISHVLNQKYGTNLPVIPHIVNLPETKDDLRDSLGIPLNAIVFGRYGGYTEFNLAVAHRAIVEHVTSCEDAYFLFMNTAPFFMHPRIIYLDKTTDSLYKTKFINTCDAMIHARNIGETFGLSVGEFSSKNRPIITCKRGDLEHIRILGSCALVYETVEDLLRIFRNFPTLRSSRLNWNAYEIYNPNYIMYLFKEFVFDVVKQKLHKTIG